MIREYSITTCEGSCAPQKTADPSIAGVKKGRPLIVSTIRNHRATAAAPTQPATNPSRKTRVSCMRSPEVACVNISLRATPARLGPAARVRGLDAGRAVHGGRRRAAGAGLRDGGPRAHRDAGDLLVRYAASVRPRGGADRDVHRGRRALRLRLGHP